jgi:hypothetical protein
VPTGGDPVLASDVTTTSPVDAADGTNISGFTSTTPVSSPICGVAFTAPKSGRVRVHVSGMVGLTAGTVPNIFIYLGLIVKTGATVGSGAVVSGGDLVTTEPGCKIGSSGVLNAMVGGGASAILPGLTPGSVYNAAAYMLAAGTGATGFAYYRAVGVDPLP